MGGTRPCLGYGRRPFLTLGLPTERRAESSCAASARCWVGSRPPPLLLLLLLLLLPTAHVQEDGCGAPAEPPELPRCTEEIVRFVVPGRSVLVANGVGAAAPLRVGVPATLNVSARDSFGEPFISSGYVVCAGFTTANKSDPSPYVAPHSVTYALHDWGDGNFTVRWIPTVAGSYHVTARLVHDADGPVASCDVQTGSTPGLLPRTLVGGQPYHVVTVGSGPTVNDTIAVHSGTVAHDFLAGKAVAGVPSTLQVTASDRYGNRQTEVVDESHLFYLEVARGVAGFTGAWATVEGRREFQGQRIWVMEELSAEESEWSVRAVPGEPGLYVAEFTAPHMEVCIEPIDDKDPNAPPVCPKDTGTLQVPVVVEVLMGPDVNNTWPVPDSPFAGNVTLMPPAQYEAQLSAVSRADSKVSGPLVASAGDNITIDVTLHTQWGQLIPWTIAFGALLSTVDLEPLAADMPSDGYPFVGRLTLAKKPGELPGTYRPGEYLAQMVQPTVAGIYTLSVTMGRYPNGHELAGQDRALATPFSVTVDAASTATAHVIFETYSPGTTIVTCSSALGMPGPPCAIAAGEDASLQLVAVDRFGNIRYYRPAVGPDLFEVKLGHVRAAAADYRSVSIEALVSPDEEARNYVAVARLTVSGDYHVQVRLYDRSGVHNIASGDDFSLRVQPAAVVPGRCWAGGPGSTQAVVGQTAAMEVRFYDSFGNFAAPSTDEVPAVRVSTNGTLELGAMMTSPGSRPGTGDVQRRVGCTPTSCDNLMCFCHFPFTYYGEEYNECVKPGSGTVSYCGTKLGRFDPGYGSLGSADYRCGIRSAAANGFSTGSMDYCMPPDQIPSRWREDGFYFEAYFLPSMSGILRLHIETQAEDSSWEICDIADVDVRHGGRILITEMHYNPPNIPVDDRSSVRSDNSDGFGDYVWEEDGTQLEYIELLNSGNADVSLIGLAFTEGVQFTFPNYVVPAGQYAVLPKSPSHPSWESVGAVSCHIIGLCTDCTSHLLRTGQLCKEMVTHDDCEDVEGSWTGYSGSLSNDGERLTLSALPYPGPDGNLTVVDTVFYDDESPWPTKPDGARLRAPPNLRRPMGTSPHMASYRAGASLERANLDLDVDSDDATLWRGSIVAGGTPCLPYMLVGEPVGREVRISDWSTTPRVPSADADVLVTVRLTGTGLAESPPETVTLLWQDTVCEEGHDAVVMSEELGQRILGQAFFSSAANQRVLRYEDELVYTARVPHARLRAESLVRMTLDIFLGYDTCKSIRLPHVSETSPFLSFWVHDPHYVPTVLPRIILFGDNFASTLHQPAPDLLLEGSERVDWRQYSLTPPTEAFWPNISGVVFIPPRASQTSTSLPNQASDTETDIQVYDGALVMTTELGHSIVFESGNLFQPRGLQSITVLDSVPSRSQGGMASPFTQHAAFNFMAGPPFRSMDVPSARWFRSTFFTSNSRRVDSQRVVLENVDPVWLQTRNRMQADDLFRMESAIAATGDGDGEFFSVYARHTNLDQPAGELQLQSLLSRLQEGTAASAEMDTDNVVEFAAASSLLSNWDGLHHNNWILRVNSTGWRLPNCEDGAGSVCAAKRWHLMPASLARTFGMMDAVDTLTDNQMVDLPISYLVTGDGPAHFYSDRPTHPLIAPLLGLTSQHERYLTTLKCSLQTTFGTGSAGLGSKLNVVEEVLLYDHALLATWACGQDLVDAQSCDGTRTRWWNETGGVVQIVPPPQNRLEQLADAFAYMRTYFTERHAYLQAVPELATTDCAYTSQYWSDELYWRRRGLPGVPKEGDSVFIPGGESLVIDVDTPVLGKLVIQGFVQVSRIPSAIVLNANCIFILNGGRLQAGTAVSPLQGLFTIQLHGTRGSYPLVQRWGSKVLAVLKGGRLDLHAKQRSPSWTRLESNARAGTRTIKLPAGAAMDWPAGDELIVSTSSHDLQQTEVVTLSSVTQSGDVVLTDALSHDHIGELYSFAGTDDAGPYDGRAIAASLTRNIRIHGVEDSEDRWGCSVSIQGHAYIERVEFKYCGKRGGSGTGTAAPAVLVDGRGPGMLSGYMRDSVARESYSDVLATRGKVDARDSLDFELTGNVVFVADGGTGYALQAPVSILSRNTAVSIYLDQAGGGGIGFDSHAFSFDSNLAVGAQLYGFRVSAWECAGLPELPINTAMACGTAGIHIVSKDDGRTRCGRLTGFLSLMNRGAGFSSLIVGSLTVTNVAAIDNAVGFKLSSLYVPGMAPTVLIVDASMVVARVGADNSDGPCQGGRPMSPTASIGVVPATFVEMRQCTEESPSYLPGGCDPAFSSPVPMAAPDSGFMEVRDTVFVNFRSSTDTCGPSFVFTQMDTTQQTVVFTKMKDITALDSGTQVPVPWFMPTTSESSDGTNHVVIEDRDGTFAGQPEAWLVSRNVGVALGCTLLGDQQALRCPKEQEFRRLVIEPLRDGNSHGSLYLGTTWNSIAIEKHDAEDDNPCNANAMTIGTVRPGCDILYRGDGDGRFWTAIDVRQPRRIRFKMQPLVANVRLRLLAGIPPRDANLPPVILNVIFPVDPVHTYFVWKDGQRVLPMPLGYDVSTDDDTGTYVQTDYSITVALHASESIEIRAERSLGVDIVVRDFNTTDPDYVAASIGPKFGINPSNIIIHADSATTEEVSVLSTRSSVHVDVLSQNPMALHAAGGPMQCRDRFTLADTVQKLAFEVVDSHDFGLTEEDWYIRRLFWDSTAFLSGCNDPNADNYDSTAIDHDPTACEFLSNRCQSQVDSSSDSGEVSGMPIDVRRDAQIAADVKTTLVNIVSSLVQVNEPQQPSSSSATGDDAIEILLVESMLIDASAIADVNLDDVPHLVSGLGVSADHVRLVGTLVSIDGAWQCSRATETPGLDTSVRACFEVAGLDLRFNDVLFRSIAAADAYVESRIASMRWLDNQPLACKVGMQHMLCGHYLQECEHTEVCASSCTRAFQFCHFRAPQPSSSLVPNIGEPERCSVWTSVIGDACGYDIDFVCPVNHLDYPTCTFNVHGMLIGGGTALVDCDVVLVRVQQPVVFPALGALSADAILTHGISSSKGRFQIAADTTIEPGPETFLRVKPVPVVNAAIDAGEVDAGGGAGSLAAADVSNRACRSSLTNKTLSMQLRASSVAVVVSPFSTMKTALLQLGASRRGADETILTALGLLLPWEQHGQSEFDLERYDVFSDVRKPKCEVASCVELLSASVQLESFLSVGEQIVGVNEDQFLADIIAEHAALSAGGNASLTGTGTGSGGRRRGQQQLSSTGGAQGASELLKDNSADNIVFALSHVLAEEMQRAVAYAETVELGDGELVLALLREAKVVTMVDTSPVVVDTIANTLSALIAYTHTTLVTVAAAVAVGGTDGAADEETANRLEMLGVANAISLLVQDTLISRAHEMMLTSIDGTPSDLLQLAQDVAMAFETEQAIAERVMEVAPKVGAIAQYEPPPEPEPEPEPEPIPEPEPEPEPEPPEPEPDYVEDRTAQAPVGNNGLNGPRVGLLAVLVLVCTSCAVVIAGVAALVLIWRRKMNRQRASTPERIYVEKTWDVPKTAKPKRHRRADKDTTIRAVVPKDMSELALMGLQATGAFVPPSVGKSRVSKKESKEQQRKRERRELIAATRSHAADTDHSGAGVRQNRRERKEAALKGMRTRRSPDRERRSPDRGRRSADRGRKSPDRARRSTERERKSPDRGRDTRQAAGGRKAAGGARTRARRSP